MAIQCGICKNIMPSASFPSHKERKHAMERRVPYIKLPDSMLRNGTINCEMVKCRFCPNRIPDNAMERHLKRCHIECHLCKKMLLKSNHDKHMQQKHGNNLADTSSLSQSKSSLQSDGMASTIDSVSMRDPSPVPYRPPPMPIQSKPQPLVQTFKSDIIRVNDWQLHNYIRQGRVYTKNGFLYLRNLDVF